MKLASLIVIGITLLVCSHVSANECSSPPQPSYSSSSSSSSSCSDDSWYSSSSSTDYYHDEGEQWWEEYPPLKRVETPASGGCCGGNKGATGSMGNMGNMGNMNSHSTAPPSGGNGGGCCGPKAPKVEYTINTKPPNQFPGSCGHDHHEQQQQPQHHHHYPAHHHHTHGDHCHDDDKIIKRKAITDLSPKEVMELRHAFERIFQPYCGNPFGEFGMHAATHGGPSVLIGATPPSGSNGWCPHHLPIFPTWHRIYLRAFEKQLGVPLPYLPWSKDGWSWDNLPSILTDTFYTDHDGTIKRNPLAGGPTPMSPPGSGGLPYDITKYRYTTRYYNGAQPDPKIVRDSVLNSEGNWEYFTFGEGGTAPVSPKVSFETAHDFVHIHIGGVVPGDNGTKIYGDMSTVPSAAFDPFFWFHHCEVDRQFQTWVEYWKAKGTIKIDPKQALRVVGQYFPPLWFYLEYQHLTAIELLETQPLGYRYDELVFPVHDSSCESDRPNERPCISIGPSYMHDHSFVVRYFLRPRDSGLEFTYETPVTDEHYAGSIAIFGGGHPKMDMEHMTPPSNEVDESYMTMHYNPIMKTIRISGHPLLSYYPIESLEVVAVFVTIDGKNPYQPTEEDLLLASVTLIS